MSVESVMMRDRFRGFLPVVVDVETGGFNSATDALLEIAAVLLRVDGEGRLVREMTIREHVRPFEGSRLDPASLAVNGIDPWHPLRIAVTEGDALGVIFREVRRVIREQDCTRAILVGHNASFDLGFLNAAATRAGIKRNPIPPVLLLRYGDARGRRLRADRVVARDTRGRTRVEYGGRALGGL